MFRRACGVTNFLWSTQGAISRRQWWAGHFAAFGLTVAGMLGFTLVLAPVTLALGLDPDEATLRVAVMAVAGLATLALVLASNALCRKRLADKGQSMALINAALALAVIEMAVKGLAAASDMLGPGFGVVAPPAWIVPIVSQFSFIAVSVLILECGVFQHFSCGHLLARHLPARHDMPGLARNLGDGLPLKAMTRRD